MDNKSTIYHEDIELKDQKLKDQKIKEFENEI